MKIKCLNCKDNPADGRLRTYKNQNTGEVLRGGRIFCSDSCEVAYCAEEDRSNPDIAKEFVRVCE